MTEQLPAGTVVGERYVVDEFLARGGFASVYRAHHQQIGRRLAIKVLDPPGRGASTDTFRQRFLSEAKIAARIEHPGVVSVFDYGLLDDGRAFIAMDLLDGHDLETELRQNGPLPAVRFLPMFVECLAALGEGHRQGIVHKDLKPSNLFIVRPGERGERLVILDFGIARAFDDPGAHVTQEGGFSGTPAYLAPEYIRHQTVSPAMDVYQMGLILVEALTGTQAVKSETSMGYLLAHCLEPVRLPKVLLDTPLGELCLRAVEKEPQLRFPDADAFREALMQVPRGDLFDTHQFAIDHAAPVEPTLAKTLQFIHVPPEAMEQLSTPPPAAAASHTVVTTDDTSRPPIFLVTVLVVLLFAVLGALVVVFSSLEPEPETAIEEPAAVVEGVAPAAPFATVPDAAEEPSPPAEQDAGVSSPVPFADLGAPELADEPPPAPDPPKPRPKPRPKPSPRPKPDLPPTQSTKPLLLSP